MIREGGGPAGSESGNDMEPTGWNTPLSDKLLIIAGLASVVVIMLSFATWMDITFTEEFEGDAHTISTQVKGIDSSLLTTFGDGYLTALFGILAITFAIAYRFTGRWSFYCAAGLAVAGLSAFVVGLYSLAYDRAKSGPGALGIVVQIDVSRTPELWILTAMALMVTAVAFVLLAIAWRNVATTEDPVEPE